MKPTSLFFEFLKEPQGTAHVSILPLTPPKTRTGSSLIFQLPKNQNQGFVINKIKYPSHKIGMHRLDPLEQPKLSCNLKPSQSFQFRGLGLAKLGKFIFEKV